MGFAAAGATLVGAYMSSQAASNAANAQSNAAGKASDTQWNIYQQQRQDAQPWMNAGTEALRGMQDPKYQQNFTMSDFQADPGYQFRMDEGNKALERSAAAKGGLMSGGTLKALTRYEQNTASAEYQNAYDRFNTDRNTTYNRLASLAGTGQVATNNVSAAGSNAANQIGANTTGAGNAQAAGYIGQANAVNNAIGSGTNTWMNYSMMNRMFPKDEEE